jgi:hypothetical protein
MSEKQEFINKPIEFLRFKKNSSDKIVYLNDKYQVERKIITKAFDGLLSKWKKVNVKIEHFPMSEIGCFKELNQTIFVKRTNVNPQTLQNMELWLKVIRKIEVINKESNIFLTASCNRIFQSDVVRGQTAPIPQNGCPQGLKITKLSEAPLTPEELNKLSEDLNNSKVLIKPVIAEQTAIGELRLIT